MSTPRTIWITGLPCSGKTTLAGALHAAVSKRQPTVMLDGDALRKTLCSDLGYAETDRVENVRRVSALCRILNDQGITAITALVSPTLALRASAKAVVGASFFEVFLSCPLAVCISRDTKGMYKKALAGELRDFTGVSAPYQEPLDPELVLDSSRMHLDDEVLSVLMEAFE